MKTKVYSTSISADNHNCSRRHILKFAAGLAGYCLAPQALSAAFAPVDGCSANAQHPDHRPDKQPYPQRTTDAPRIEFRFVDSKCIPGMISLGQGTIVNHTADVILINCIAPHTLTTENGCYDIAAHLAGHPIRLDSGQQRHFWVRPVSIAPLPNRKITLRGSPDLPNTLREPVAISIENPGVGIPAKVQPAELMVATALT